MKTRCLGCMAEFDSSYGLCPYCGYELGTGVANPLHMAPGAVLANRYLVGKVIGYGGFGVTYIGWDNTLRQRVAIKEYLPSEFATRASGQTHITIFGGNKTEQFADGLSKFVDEAKRLARFQNEAGIVRVFDSFSENNTAYIIMEYLDGETLTSYLEREGKVPVDQAIEMLLPVIRSLETIHAQGIIHRDIAPDNIMITKDGQVKLIDFGAARYATTSHSRSLTVIIKPGYSPEEQYRSRGDQGPHTDVYALSAVLYRMVTGVRPPDALERRAYGETKKKDILIPPSKNCKIDPNVENAILNAMNVQIEDRTATAQAFLEELTSQDSVQRVMGKIKAIDLVKWPLWAKIVLPSSVVVIATLFALLITGKIGFESHLLDTFILGSDMSRVPSVINYSVGVAQDRLEEQELAVVVGGREASDIIPANMVLRQSVGAGEVVAKETRVDLYISAAAEPVIEENIMPDVSYYAQAEALDMLAQVGAVATVEEMFSSDVAEGVVVYASVWPGETLRPGDPVTVYVSKGPDPAVLALQQAQKEQEEREKKGQKESPKPTKSTTASAPPNHTSISVEGSQMTPVVIPDVYLNRSVLSLFVGDASTLSAGGGNGSYFWSSSNTNVVTVSDGRVSAVGKGSATITVTSGDKSATCAVNIQDYSLSLSPSDFRLFKGERYAMSLAGAPAGATITWGSTDPDVASVTNGTVKAVDKGQAKITAQFSQGGRTYSASAVVRVISAGLTLSDYSESLYTGQSFTLQASTSPGDVEVSWSSSDNSVARVRDGYVTAVGAGSAYITASFTYSGQTFTERCSVTVREISISLRPGSITMAIGDEAYISASVSPSDATVTWGSSDTSVVTVDNKGHLTAQSNGSAAVAARIVVGGETYESRCQVRVEAPGVELSESRITLWPGERETLSASVSPSGQRLSWQSDNEEIVSVDRYGGIEALREGTAVITVSFTLDDQEYSDACRVTVQGEPEIELSPREVFLQQGDSMRLNYSVRPEELTVEWRTNDENVVVVDDTGKLYSVEAGTATVTLAVNMGSRTYFAECQVTVTSGEEEPTTPPDDTSGDDPTKPDPNATYRIDMHYTVPRNSNVISQLEAAGFDTAMIEDALGYTWSYDGSEFVCDVSVWVSGETLQAVQEIGISALQDPKRGGQLCPYVSGSVVQTKVSSDHPESYTLGEVAEANMVCEMP